MGKSKRIFLAGAAALWLLAGAAGAVSPEEDAAAASDSQKEARDLLMAMAECLAGQDQFSVKLLAGYDVVQASGEKIEFLEARDIVLVRPDRLRIEERGGNGSTSGLLFDGSKITVWDGTEGVFSQADQPGTIDDAVVYFVRDLRMRLPLEAFLTSRLPVEFERRVRAVDYVEMTEAFGEPAHHLAGSTDTVDFQVWIADGERPLPLRIVLTYPEPGQPQYRAQFSDWNLKPKVRKDSFAFQPPPEARKILFAVQLLGAPFETVPPENAAGEGVHP
jgi:hypothetical protein